MEYMFFLYDDECKMRGNVNNKTINCTFKSHFYFIILSVQSVLYKRFVVLLGTNSPIFFSNPKLQFYFFVVK